ncbi:MAG: hypothetical protein LBJ60_05905, partial [Tannerellaceae bacterium]|nr:hypothetical protein [Tannerellaceae bacterium]
MENAVISIEYVMDNNIGKVPINILVDLSFIDQKFVTASVSTYALELIKELTIIPRMKFSFIAEKWFIPSLERDFDQVRCFSVPTKRWLRYLPFKFLRSYILAMIRRSYIRKTINISEYNVYFTPFLCASSILTNRHPSIAVLHDARP